MKRRVKQFIEKEKLLTPETKIIAGLSGGADSIVLLSLLQQLGYNCVAAHCNFHLRDEESDRDEQLAAGFAATHSIPFFKMDFDTTEIARERKISIEMAARDLRYEWFEKLRQEHAAEAIAVAHHQDDSIETLLLNLIRGAGINGLTGIKPKMGYVVRPLLCVNKKEIVRYAEKNQLPYCIDSSNLKEEYTRNKIRRQVLPLLQELNPGVNQSLLRTMDHLNEVFHIYQSHIQTALNELVDEENQRINIDRLSRYPSPESILFEWLKNYGFGKETIQSVYQSMQGQSGKIFYSDTHRLVRDRKYFIINERFNEQKPSVFYLNEDQSEMTFPVHLTWNICEKNDDFQIEKNPNIAYFDADRLTFPLTLRQWRTGDRFVPFGMNGSRKVSDYFNDQKLSQPEKENAWLLCSGETICWIVGYRTDQRFRITASTTKICTILARNS